MHHETFVGSQRRTVGLSCLTFIYRAFLKGLPGYRELSFKDTIIPLPYSQVSWSNAHYTHRVEAAPAKADGTVS